MLTRALTNALRRTASLWHFWFELSLLITVVCSSFVVWQPLKQALALKDDEMDFKTCIDKLEVISKITGIVASIFALCALFLPSSIWKVAESQIAQIYGANGWVYYEVGEEREITKDGNFYLLKESPTGYYNEIEVGDKLRVVGNANFRSGKGSSEPKTFVLVGGDCVIITSKPRDEYSVKKAKSGGWLKVATSPCGLF